MVVVDDVVRTAQRNPTFSGVTLRFLMKKGRR
jgi:hypothetical protein